MTFPDSFTTLDRIQLLQRSILVDSFAYYELDGNILADYQYDNNCKQLMRTLTEHPEEAKQSRYYGYFHDFTGETGFHLVARVREKDPELYRHIWIDALMALDSKSKRFKED